MSQSSSSSSSGIGFTGLLTIVFITLKLTGFITWSWLWVLSPLWISTLVVLAIFAPMIGLALLIKRQERKRRSKLTAPR